MDESASTAEQQRISAMDRETEARWQRVIVEENPAFSRLMGVRFTSGSRDRIAAELTVGEDLANRNGVMHGGAIMAGCRSKRCGPSRARNHSRAQIEILNPNKAVGWTAEVTRGPRLFLLDGLLFTAPDEIRYDQR